MKISQYPRNADGTPMDLRVGVRTDTSGNGGARLTNQPVGPDGAPIDAQALILVDSNGNPIDFDIHERKTPRDFGAVGYNPLSEVDDTVALQAFFDHAKNPINARRYVYDWTGEWMTSATIWAVYWDGGEPNVERRFIMGTLRVAPKASLPGGVALYAALEIVGFRQRWDGVCGIHPSGNAGQYNYGTYYDRRYRHGVRARLVSNSHFGQFYIDDAIRDAFWLSSDEYAGFVANGISIPTSNNIACKIEGVWARTSGSNYRWSEATPLVASARVVGSVVSGNPYTNTAVFGTVTAGMFGSFVQQTKLTVPSTADLELYDLLWCRVELVPAIYGTIAADNAAKTITWTAGDPTNLDGAGNGLQVGDVYPAFQGGANVGTEFRIVSFGGTSNRTINITPAPVTHAASADPLYTQYGEKNWHWVAQVNDATHVCVFPWVASRINSSFHIVHGATLKCSGSNDANVTIGTVYALLMGTGLYAQTLYAPKIGTLLAESTPIGARLADPIDNICLGISIEHGHVGIVDGCDVSILSGSDNVYGTLNLQSAFDLGRCVGCGARLDFNTARPNQRSLGHLQIFKIGGMLLETAYQQTNEGAQWDFYGISNAKRLREVYIHIDTTSLVVSFDRDEACLLPKHHWAEIIWTGPAGAAPTGTLTLNMEATLAALGWTFAGAGAGVTYAITAPAKTLVLKLQFLPATKKIAITRINGA